MATERHARAMGTDLHVIVAGPGGTAGDRERELADRALVRVAQLEARWSRFIPQSEVSRLNGAFGAPVVVSDDTVALVDRAIDAWLLTEGLVDCTLLDDLLRAGYDRPFDELPPNRPAPAGVLRQIYGGDPGDIEIQGNTVTLPLGLGFDPGGIGKGLAADLVTGELLAAGAAGACVNLGGDLRVRGLGPDGGAWTISVDHPRHDGPVALVGLHDGAVASSTVLRRRWQVGGEDRHHLLDPHTGRPARSPLAFASAVAAEGWQAEAMAKAFLLRGAAAPLVGGVHAAAADPGTWPFTGADGGAEGLVVDHAGAVTVSPGFTRFTGGMRPAPILTTEVPA